MIVGSAPAQPVVVACSGGADSVALLRLLAASPTPIAVVARVDHGLRDSGDETDLVAGHCRELGLDFVAIPVAVRAGGSLQDAARRARWTSLRAVAAAVAAPVVATGHTADDQAETVLMRMARGAGTTGMAAMRPFERGIWRPLLGRRRHALRALCETEGWAFADDPTNTDRRHERNRVRHDVLPRLGPRAVPALARLAALAADDDDLLEQLAAGAPIETRPDGTVAIPLEWLAATHPALARRAVRRAVRLAGATRMPPAARIEEARAGRALSLGCGWATECRRGWLAIVREDASAPPH